MRNARFLFLPVLVLIAGAFTAAAETKTKGKAIVIGVYDLDSVLRSMPEYHAIALYDSAEVTERSKVEIAYLHKEFDSLQTQWSPLIRQLKEKQLGDLDEAYQAGNIEGLRGCLDGPLYRRIWASEPIIAKKKNIPEVKNKGRLNFDPYRNDKNLRPVNVTAEMIEEVNRK